MSNSISPEMASIKNELALAAAEESLFLTTPQQRQAERLATIKLFADTVDDQFRTPLSLISGYAELVSTRVTLPKNLQDSLAEITRGSQVILYILDRLRGIRKIVTKQHGTDLSGQSNVIIDIEASSN